MLRAVLFDWGGTLVRGGYDAELAAAGHEAGLAVLRDVPGIPTRAELSARFVSECLPDLVSAREDEVDYVDVILRLLRSFVASATRAHAERFVEAEHRAWRPGHEGAHDAAALLEAVRRRGLATGLVSNAFDPPQLAHAELERLGLRELLDVAVFSSETGKRKPHPAGFQRALDALELGPEEALFVGDRLREDIEGAANLGMRTIQALWFGGDVRAGGREPDVRARTRADVLREIDRLLGRGPRVASA